MYSMHAWLEYHRKQTKQQFNIINDGPDDCTVSLHDYINFGKRTMPVLKTVIMMHYSCPSNYTHPALTCMQQIYFSEKCTQHLPMHARVYMGVE